MVNDINDHLIYHPKFDPIIIELTTVKMVLMIPFVMADERTVD